VFVVVFLWFWFPANKIFKKQTFGKDDGGLVSSFV